MPSSSTRTGLGGLALVVAVVLAGCAAPESGEEDRKVDSSGWTFAPDSPWNRPIPADPVVDPGSAHMVAALMADGTGHALLHEFGVPVYEADDDTPRVSVRCTQTLWGRCPLQGEPVPVPPEARPSTGSDAAMVVIDRSSGRVYDFWQAERTSSGDWTTSWATWAPLDGWGSGGRAGGSDRGATGAGVNLLAGLIRVSEIEAGTIPHALALVSGRSCPDVFRYPATKTDGQAVEFPCIPQGARVQLDPTIDLDAISGITPGERAVARALQSYGGYVRDSGGASLGVAFEHPTGGENPYPEAGLSWDYFDMPHIPWDRLRVLRTWDGS